MSSSPATENHRRIIETELTGVRTELTRLDAKCSTLVGLAAAALAFLLTQAGKGPVSVRVTLTAAALALALAAVLLLAGVLRPRLGTSGFNRYATLTPAAIARLVEHGPPDPAEDLATLSALVLAKQRRLRRAVDLLVAALLLIATGLVISAV